MVAKLFDDNEATEFRERVTDWLDRVRPAEWDEHLSGKVEPQRLLEIRHNWDRLVFEGGLAGLTWPVEHGGQGLGPIEEFLFFEAAAEAGAPDMLNFIGYDLAGPALMQHGTPDQRARYLPGIIEAKTLWCEGFSEPNAGSDMAAVSTAATRVDGGWVVNGQKIWTSVAGEADFCYLLARTSSELPRHRNLSVLILPMRQSGVDIRPIRQITGEYEFSEVFFNDAFVPDGNLLGEENGGWHLGTLAGFRLGRGIKDGLRRYVLIRSAMNTLLDCSADVDSRPPAALDREVQLLRWHVLRATEALARGLDAQGPGSATRLMWSGLWQRIAQRGLEVGCPTHEAYWRREFLHCRSLTIAGGTSQIQRTVIANTVLKLPR